MCFQDVLFLALDLKELEISEQAQQYAEDLFSAETGNRVYFISG